MDFGVTRLIGKIWVGFSNVGFIFNQKNEIPNSSRCHF